MGVLQKDTVYGTSISFRFLQGFFYFFALILVSTYTANLTTFLLSNQSTSIISSIDDIKKKGIKFTTVRNSAASSYFDLIENIAYKTTIEYSNSTEDAIQAVVDKKVDAFVWVNFQSV